MSSELKWQKIDKTAYNRPHYLGDDDECWYLMEYQSGKGYSASPANQLVSNFKKDHKYRNQDSWKYKLSAVKTFAEHLSKLFDPNHEFVISFIPSSKKKGDPEYDERFEMLRDELLKLNLKIRFEEPITVKGSRASAHSSVSRPKPEEIKATYQWNGFQNPPSQYLILVDDVITSGSQFRGYSDIVIQNHPNLKVIGVFWAKTSWPSPLVGII